MDNTDYRTGWSVKAWIEVKKGSVYAFIDKWKCETSGQMLEAECLMVSRQNFKHRGNETDELHHYNRSTSPEEYAEVWEKWDELKARKREELQQIANDYNIKIKILS